jgi:23S rRNA (uracil1939-C5)-methyltransferase
MVAAAQGAGHGALLDEGGGVPVLAYALPDFGITMPFKPTDFHPGQPAHQPRAGQPRAAPAGCAAHERVIDWFCGLGNFTLPLATQAREVLGIEGSEALVARSRENWKLNQASALAGNCAGSY